jgi:polyvinyl alcohol dehydrogenase (cytochrome)
MRITISTTLLLGLALGVPAAAQGQNGEALFAQHCAACHVNPVEDDVPTRAEMGTLAANAIVESLTDGTMRLQGQPLTPAERVAIAELVTGRPVLTASTAPILDLCTVSTAFAPGQGPVWNGWGLDTHNARFQPDAGGITAAAASNGPKEEDFGDFVGAPTSAPDPSTVPYAHRKEQQPNPKQLNQL